LLAIWQSFIANNCWQFGNIILLNTRWQFGVQVLLNICWQFGVILSLNSNNSVTSFSWTRGSKLCFLTRFYYFSRYFLILVFLQKLLLTNFFTPFSAAQESNIFSRFLVPLALNGSTLYVHPHISGTECMRFSKQDAQGNLVVDSTQVFFCLSAFCQRFLMQTSIGQMQIIPFLFTQYPQAGTLLRDISLR
jgi:hypothetical protein